MAFSGLYLGLRPAATLSVLIFQRHLWFLRFYFFFSSSVCPLFLSNNNLLDNSKNLRDFQSPMSILPDELWSKILELGTSTSRLSCRDLCSVSIASRRLRRLSGDPSLWATLLSFDFPSPSSSSSSSSSEPPSKSLYKLRYHFLLNELFGKSLIVREF